MGIGLWGAVEEFCEFADLVEFLLHEPVLNPEVVVVGLVGELYWFKISRSLLSRFRLNLTGVGGGSYVEGTVLLSSKPRKFDKILEKNPNKKDVFHLILEIFLKNKCYEKLPCLARVSLILRVKSKAPLDKSILCFLEPELPLEEFVTALSITVVLLVDEDVLSASLSLLLANKFVELLLDAGL